MEIIKDDITKNKTDCIIMPSNGLGVTDKGVYQKVSKMGGPEVQNSAKEACFKHGLYKPGQAYLGSSGFLVQRGIKSIIHAVIIYRHPAKTKIEDCRDALISSLVLASEQGFKKISVPSFGIEPRNIDEYKSAETVVNNLFLYDRESKSSIAEFDISIIDTNIKFIDYCKMFYDKRMKNVKS